MGGNDRMKGDQEQQQKENRFIKCVAGGMSREDVQKELDMSDETYREWSDRLKKRINQKREGLARKAGMEKIRKIRRRNTRITLVLCGIFVLFSLSGGVFRIADSIRKAKLKECLTARAQLNYLTGERESLLPGGPAEVLAVENTPVRRRSWKGTWKSAGPWGSRISPRSSWVSTGEKETGSSILRTPFPPGISRV